MAKYKNPSLKFSIIALIIANFIPLIGVLFWQWNASTILVLYWLENFVIGFYTVLKIFKSKNSASSITYYVNNKPRIHKNPSRIFSSLYFLFVYGIFTLVHGVFIFLLFKLSLQQLTTVIFPFLLLFISHGISFLVNFIGQKEYETVSFNQLLIQPYKRIVPIHMAIIGGAFLINILELSKGAVIILVLFKILIDFGTHTTEHKLKHN